MFIPKNNISFFKDAEPYTIVGIDLTGSAKKASGWAVLQNGTVTTKRVLTDDDLLSDIALINPTLVCIDCPLSLPVGRLTVFDDDPGRAQYGITREAERLLLKRGIRSYPPLIKSMQNLTARGIALSAKIRALGIEVIEGYPGGAQDILGLPRKQKSLPLLIDGLKQFGIEGAYHSTKTSHDEVDAITCALVGLYYLTGDYDAIGNDTEGYIIIPKI